MIDPSDRDNIYASSRRRCLMTVKHTHAANNIYDEAEKKSSSDDGSASVFVARLFWHGTIRQTIYYK